MKETVLSTEYAIKVYIINNEKNIHLEMANLKKVNELIKKRKIDVINNSEIVEIECKNYMEKVILKKNKIERKICLFRAFLSTFDIPMRLGLAKILGVKVNSKKEIIVNQHSKTNISGFLQREM
ncbi:MAG: hypothetical protein QXK37_03425 [Candidatus Woesearchaeota archaeon]